MQKFIFFLRNISVLLFLCLICVSCSDRYQEGYNDGYEEGYYDGHKKGHEEGHLDGYMDGTVAFIDDSILPTLGLCIVIVIAITALYFMYRFYKDPTKRVIDNSVDRAEAKRQQIIVKKEISRRIRSEEEIARLKAANLASQIYESSKKALSESYTDRELEKIKKEIEERIFNAQSSKLDEIIAQYEKAYGDLKNAKHINSREKAELYASLKDVVIK